METNGNEFELKKKERFRRISMWSTLSLTVCWIIIFRLFVFNGPSGEFYRWYGEFYRWFSIIFGGFIFAFASYYLPVGLFWGIRKIIFYIRANHWLKIEKIK